MPSFRAAALCGLLSLAGPAFAAPPCLTEAEGRSVVAYALPVVIEAAARRCRTVLPASAWLNRSAATQAQRYRREGRGDIRAALPVMEKLLGEQMPDFLDDGTATSVAQGLITERVTSQLRTKDCQPASRIGEYLSPLPLGNVSALAVVLVQAGRDKLPLPDFSICPAVSAGRL